MRAMIGRTPSYLVTAGSDSIIATGTSPPAKCYTVAGLVPGQPKSIYEAPSDNDVAGRLFMSYDSAIPAQHHLAAAPAIEGGQRALVPNNAFRDAVLDLKYVDCPPEP